MTRLEKWKTATPWEMQALLKSYEDTGLAPEEISFIRSYMVAVQDDHLAQEVIIDRLRADNKRLRDRLVISPYGDDKIDELEVAIEFLRHKVDTLRADNKRLREALSEGQVASGKNRKRR